MTKEIWLIRHGETEWSLSGAHTGRTDIPLTARGEQSARCLRPALHEHTFAAVFTSPLQRALETCKLAGFEDEAVIDPNLMEWWYGDYEGRSSAEIQETRPGWSIWKDGVVNGETIGEVAARAQAVIARALSVDGDVLLFAHGHLLRILTACWLELAPQTGRHFALETGRICRLGFEKQHRVILGWNVEAAVSAAAPE